MRKIKKGCVWLHLNAQVTNSGGKALVRFGMLRYRVRSRPNFLGIWPSLPVCRIVPSSPNFLWRWIYEVAFLSNLVLEIRCLFVFAPYRCKLGYTWPHGCCFASFGSKTSPLTHKIHALPSIAIPVIYNKGIRSPRFLFWGNKF